MRLIGTILQLGTAYAVYSDEPVAADEILTKCATEFESAIVFEPSVRLVAIYDEAPPLVLEPDLSESVHDQASG